MANSTSPMIVTLDHFNRLRDHFKKRYFLSNCNGNFGGQEVQVSWDLLSLAVQSFINTYQVQAGQTALRFVHCYDSGKNVLYQRLQILTMTPDPIIPNVYELVDSPCAWYALENGTISPTTNTDLTDQPYLDFFYYCTAEQCTPDSLDRLADDPTGMLYARTVTLPWTQEIEQLYADNGSPVNATLCVCAGAPFALITPSVKFGHTLVLYLRKEDGTAMLDNVEGPAPFYNKAADMGTMCPPACEVYLLPIEL